jgi:two-component system response regulator AtoC
MQTKAQGVSSLGSMTRPALNGRNGQTGLQQPPDEVLFGFSQVMQKVRSKLEKVVETNVPILIQGESGTGKEIIAKFIHLHSCVRTGPFTKLNCPAIPGTLLESEFFGYKKGAFTGADETKPGRVEMARNGTLFLDEIGELDPGLQAKLLQFLQDGQFCPIGGQEDKSIEVRVLCATNRNLEAEIGRGTFRQDLFYRINVVGIQLPKLQERAADIPVISDFLREFYSRKFDMPARPLSAHKLASMQQYSWPGNIRELENVIKCYVILGTEDAIALDSAPITERPGIPEFPLQEPISLRKVSRQAVREFESKIIFRMLQTHDWNRKLVARRLSISYRSLLYKLREAGVRPRRQISSQTPSNLDRQ